MARYDIPPKVREFVKARDKQKCVYCGTSYAIQIAHVFVNRSHCGLAVPENLVCLCIEHHMAMDNGKEENSKPVREHCERYLHSHYEIDVSKLKYKKGII